ncbi:MAG: response regulator [SAR324 cluster bacterium]|nr:response regulator [SAR324 cluster bacterium]
MDYHHAKRANSTEAERSNRSGVRIAHWISVVIADVGLPSGMNGAELVNEVRRHYPDLKSLLVTAYDEKALRAYGAYATGANILNKPYGKEQLATAIEACMSKI